MYKSMRVWDVPTRVFHWLYALSFCVAYLTAESERYRDIHVLLGYTLLGLLAFRLFWGFAGSKYARFDSFLYKPAEVYAYLLTMFRARPDHYAGHNPAGSVAIWLLLLLGLCAGTSGVLVYQDIGGDRLTELHELASNAMLAGILVHLSGVLLGSLLHRENLPRSMVTGYKQAGPEQGISRSYPLLGAALLAAVAAFWLVYPTLSAP